MLTLVIQQQRAKPEPALKPILKHKSTVELAQIIPPSDLVVVRSLGTPAVPHILASAHPHTR